MTLKNKTVSIFTDFNSHHCFMAGVCSLRKFGGTCNVLWSYLGLCILCRCDRGLIMAHIELKDKAAHSGSWGARIFASLLFSCSHLNP